MKKEIPVACCHTVFTKEERIDYKDAWGELEKEGLELRRLNQGLSINFLVIRIRCALLMNGLAWRENAVRF
ncbi:hypothetical protein L1N85_19610 [Paenibacillus alkaliterrae]|uniref:hypothetical protein n=1 Tax=Paenibacillus alkaliterrae TaxID=320909 RepID=UPI001F364DB7|nr:hypothetical protein [Paenibacillus alkaliterrae]MCF2940604.1 hypothetical protein [Paenibacillus alkaliterrae]